jgi:hypothetical protein
MHAWPIDRTPTARCSRAYRARAPCAAVPSARSVRAPPRSPRGRRRVRPPRTGRRRASRPPRRGPHRGPRRPRARRPATALARRRSERVQRLGRPSHRPDTPHPSRPPTTPGGRPQRISSAPPCRPRANSRRSGSRSVARRCSRCSIDCRSPNERAEKAYEALGLAPHKACNLKAAESPGRQRPESGGTTCVPVGYGSPGRIDPMSGRSAWKARARQLTP